MKAKKIILKSLLVIAVTGLTLTSCKKENNDDYKDTSASSDNAFAEATYNDINNIADQADQGSLTSYKSIDDANLLSACANITKDTTIIPHMITVDFGTTNCTCSDGRERRGKILISYSGRYRDSASVHTITFDNYYVNDNKISGTKTVTNNGHNTAGNLNWSISVNGQIDMASGGFITWTSNRTRELLSGENSNGTINWGMSKWGLTGSASGASSNGKNYTANITTQLVRDLSCGLGKRRHFVKGVLEMTPSDKPKRIIDFGDGTCDDIATVTINGKTYTIHLK